MDTTHVESLVGLQKSFHSLHSLLHRSNHAAIGERTVSRTDADIDEELGEARNVEP